MIEGRESYQVAERPQTLPARTLGELLNETFAIYRNHFWRFIGLAALVQVPVSLLSLLPPSVGTSLLTNFAGGWGGVLLIGAITYGVGQHYLGRPVEVRECYSKVWFRVLSLGVVGTVLAGLGLLAEYLGTTAATGRSPATGVLFLVFSVPAAVLLMYAVFTPQSMIMEGLGPVGAVRRSYSLVRGNWWRVLGIVLIVVLVVIGLALVLLIPFALASSIAGAEDPNALGTAVQFLGGLVAAVAVPPVAAIALTLLYYDLRVRREQYDLAALSHEMGMAPV